MRGGRHRSIRSHCIAFDCTPGPPILFLPRSIEDVASYRVVMVGEFTSEQTSKVRKMHRIRNIKVRELLEFYQKKIICMPMYSLTTRHFKPSTWMLIFNRGACQR
jgi:hypothetical protein